MLLGEANGVFNVRVEPYWRIVLHGGFLAPQQWNRSSGLDVASKPIKLASCWVLHLNDMLALHKISNVSFIINASYYESPAGSSTILLGNKDEVEFNSLAWLGFHSYCSEVGKAKNARHPEWCKFDFLREVLEEVMVESKFLNVVQRVRIEVLSIS